MIGRLDLLHGRRTRVELGRELEKALELLLEPARIGPTRPLLWHVERNLVGALQEVEHRTVVILEQPTRRYGRCNSAKMPTRCWS